MGDAEEERLRPEEAMLAEVLGFWLAPRAERADRTSRSGAFRALLRDVRELLVATFLAIPAEHFPPAPLRARILATAGARRRRVVG